ncbi:MAG: class I SAM-dependent methyltransferase [Acidimicrobiia bacterium]
MTDPAPDDEGGGRASVDGTALSGVPETLLWTLRNRAEESARTDSAYSDPMAEDLYRRIEHHYGFGKPSQSHPLRALAFDEITRRFLADHPSGTVVALGEGLQTSFWRIGDPMVRWLSVDLPEAIALRERLLPAEPNLEHLACSALDRTWMDRVDPTGGVLLTAEGLLMYFDPADVRSLLADCAVRFPGATLVFDSIPHWFSRMTLKGLKLSDRYKTPPMPFALSVRQARSLADTIPGVRTAIDLLPARGRGIWGNRLARSVLPHFPYRPSITVLEFDGP